MKRIQHWRRDGSALTTTLRVFAALEAPAPTKEEKAAMREAEKEARAEREAIQAVERDAEQARAAARLADWRAEAGPPRPPKVWAADPKPIREAVGKLQQGRMF